jgi:D-inositol-3-phosphate glycosyltransferase
MSQKLKIAMLAVHSCPFGKLGTRDTGGMNVYVRELSRYLGVLGHVVDIFTRSHQPGESGIQKPFENVRLIHIPAGPVEELDKMEQWAYMPELLRNLETFTRNEKAHYELVHSHYWLSGFVGEQVAQQWNVPHVTMFHTLGLVKNLLPIGEHESGIRLDVEKQLVAESQGIICATPAERKALTDLYSAKREKLVIVPCGVDTALFHPLDKQTSREALRLGSGKIILFVGRIETIKGLDNLILALKSVRENIDARLLIIGGDEHSKEEVARLKKLVSSLGIIDFVEFLGTVAQSELPSYYSATDVLAVSSYAESFCMVILEALACGTPVVSTSVGVAPSVITNGLNGWLAQNNQPEHLAASLEKVLGGMTVDAERVRCSALGYDWAQVAAHVETEYLSLLALDNRKESK